MNTTDAKPWYRQFWPWALILLPASAVIASLFTLIIFNQHQVSLVSEDYYKEGKGINQNLTRLQQATALNISAKLTHTDDSVTIELNKGITEKFMPVTILFQHRTLPEKDITQLLTPDFSGNYRLSLKEGLSGPWYIEIRSYDDSWLISAKANFPTSTAIELTGK